MTNRLILTALLTLALCGCSLTKRVNKAMAKVETEYAATKAWDELPVRTISWQQALHMMKEHNLDILRQKDSIKESERDEMSVYTQMIPGVTYYSYFTSSLRDLTNQINSNQANTSINVNFSIPTLTQVPYRVYASKATTYANIKALEGKERELTATLYRHVRAKELAEAQKKLEEETNSEKNPNPRVAEKDGNWGEIAKVLGDSSARWVILPSSMPHVRWEKYSARLDKLDQLIVCQFALRIEQARMGQYGIALQYLPTINTSLYSPSLFSSTGGTYSGAFLDSRDTKINLSINYSLDTKMDRWNQYMRSKARYEQTKHEVAAQLMDYRNKLKTIRKSYAEYVIWRGVMQKKLDYLRNSPPETPDAYLTRQSDIASLRKELLSQESQSIETEAALILQYGLIE